VRLFRRLAIAVVLLAVLFAIGLPIAPRLGFATPFQQPATLHFRGRDYIGPSCVSHLRANERPLHQVASVFGWFTLPRPILIPSYETRLPAGATPAVLYVRGTCLEVYGLSGGP
jgi:hypothetical protein